MVIFTGKVFFVLSVLVFCFENATSYCILNHFVVSPKSHIDFVTMKILNYHLKFLYQSKFTVTVGKIQMNYGYFYFVDHLSPSNRIKRVDDHKTCFASFPWFFSFSDGIRSEKFYLTREKQTNKQTNFKKKTKNPPKTNKQNQKQTLQVAYSQKNLQN